MYRPAAGAPDVLRRLRVELERRVLGGRRRRVLLGERAEALVVFEVAGLAVPAAARRSVSSPSRSCTTERARGGAATRACSSAYNLKPSRGQNCCVAGTSCVGAHSPSSSSPEPQPSLLSIIGRSVFERIGERCAAYARRPLPWLV